MVVEVFERTLFVTDIDPVGARRGYQAGKCFPKRAVADGQVGVDFFVSARTHAWGDAPRQELGIFGAVQDEIEKLFRLVRKDLLFRVGRHQRVARRAAKSLSAW